jgi:3-dehydroquinate dehydratase-2
MPKPIYILNGPNLNLLGQREPEIYGSASLDDVKLLCDEYCAENGYTCSFHQSNIEGELVDLIQEAGKKGAALLINPAAYTHTSVALFDAIKAISVPTIEIHISQPAAREAFRQTSYVAQAATGSITGFGINSYLLGLKAAILKLQ